ncbi:ankyrin repeat-containing domain protein [Mycena crocata]|nr:ankyrin repeat-containing domain protein [Mycena crocata]
MPDILGLVVSTLQLVDTLVKAREYVKGVQDAPKEQRELLSEVQRLQPLLAGLQRRLTTNKFAGTVNGIQHFEQPLVRLDEILEQLSKKLHAPHGFAKLSSRIVWPLWGKNDVQIGLNAVERFKTLLGTWLALDMWDAAQEQKENHSVFLQSIRCAAAENTSGGSIGALTSLHRLAEQQEQDRILLQSIESGVQQLTQYETDKQRETCIEWLSPINFSTRQQDIFNTRQPASGEWLLGSDPFKGWLLGFGSRLWCTGMPGAGKTVLASIAVHHLRETLGLPETIGVAVIYLNHKETKTHSPQNLLASLWCQPVLGKAVCVEVQHLYQKHHEPRSRPSLDDLHRILCATVAEYSKVFLVVDGLDEYPEENRHILLTSLSALGPNVNLMFTSRPHINISIPLGEAERLEIRATTDDIRRFVNAQIAKSPQLSKHIQNVPELLQEIETLCVERSEGMFRLAKLHIASLASKHTVKAARDAMKEMPGDLYTAYDEIMQRINQQSQDDRRLAFSVLAWISNAKRLLRVSELREALAVEPGTSKLDPDNLLDMEVILSVCAGLVIVDQADNVVRPIHYTMQHYLDCTQHIHFPTAQTDITIACITYLSFDSFAKTSDSMTLPRMFNLQRVHPFLNYAVDYCLVHARGKPETDIQDVLLLFIANSARWLYLWVFQQDVTWGLCWSPSKLFIAALFDLIKITRYLISRQDGVDDVDVVLRAAVANGYRDMVSLLIEHGADVNTEGKGEESMLQIASHFGHHAVATHLIANGANVNMQGGKYGTTLQAAAARGHMAVVRLLVDNAADINSVGGTHGTALWAASSPGHLEAHADVDMQSGGSTALLAASGNGHLELVRLLLLAGADVNGQGVNECTALQEAAYHGHAVVVRLLIASGAHIDAHGGSHGRALRAASASGHKTVVQTLLNHGADINARGRRFGTALNAAFHAGHEQVVQLLLENGAHLYEQGEAMLWSASDRGQEEVVRLLLASGADVNARRKFSGTALQAAFDQDHQDVVRLLLINGAAFSDQEGGALLRVAAERGHGEIMHLLLESGINVNGQDGTFALRMAAERGKLEAVRVLLSHGADVNTLGSELPHYNTPLQGAAANGQVEIVRLLLAHGAHIGARGKHYDNALQAACESGHEDVVRLLIQTHSAASSPVGIFGAALQAAATCGHTKIVQLLLDNVTGFNQGAAMLREASKCGYEEEVRLLITNGADVDAVSGDQSSVAQPISIYENEELLWLLLENGADINQRGGCFGTALYAASEYGKEEVVRLLLQYGAFVDARGGYYKTALQAASEHGHENIVTLLLDNGVDINARGGGYNTALHLASAEGYDEVVRLLLAHGANLNVRAGYHDTAIQAASNNGHLGVVRLLLDNGADVNVRDSMESESTTL